MEVYEKYSDTVVAIAKIPHEEVSKFGVVDGVKIDEKTWEIKKIIEKPKPEDAPTDYVLPGKYIITPEVFKVLSEMTEGKSGEIRLADAFDLMLKNNRPIYGRILDGEWLDTGDKFNFLKATIHMGLKHPEVGEKLKNYLKGCKDLNIF